MQSSQQCRLALAKALQFPSIRASLERLGHALFLDDNGPTMDMIENRYVLTKVEMPSGSRILVNGWSFEIQGNAVVV